MDPLDRRKIAASAARNHSVVLPTLLDELGVTAKQRRAFVRRGEWRRLDSGVHVLAGASETFGMRATAALAALPEAALSHQSSIRVHGSDVDDRHLHLAVPVGGPTRAPGAILHQTRLDPRDIVVRDGLRVTTLERTLVDLGATMGHQELQRCMEDHLVRRTTTFARLEGTFHRLARPGRNGVARTRTVLAILDGNPPSESELEAMLHRLVAAQGLPAPVRQVSFEWTDTETGRVDCWFPDPGVIVELDGRRFHARLAAFERDRRRDQAALLHKIPTIRFTHHQITGEPDWVVRVLRSQLA